MTAPSGRIYPVKVTKRDLELHRLSLAALDGGDTLAVRTALRHRIACAERFEEAKAKPLTPMQKDVAAAAVRGALAGFLYTGDSVGAAGAARCLVRISRWEAKR